jgi:hypothetical protein
MRLVDSDKLHRKSGSILGHSQPSLRDWIGWMEYTQDFVLGYYQPPLRGC